MKPFKKNYCTFKLKIVLVKSQCIKKNTLIVKKNNINDLLLKCSNSNLNLNF